MIIIIVMSPDTETFPSHRMFIAFKTSVEENDIL